MSRAALVTGASRGIGRAIADRLAVAGFDLMLSARSAGLLKTAAEALRAHGGRVDCVTADLSVESDVLALAETCATHYPQLDTLVLCGGTGTAGAFEDYPIHRLDKQFAVNVRASFLLVQHLLPMLRAAAAASDYGARVVAVASLTGLVAEPGLAAYGASKAALIAMCEAVTVAESANGVSATAIAPGYVDTDMSGWVRDQIDQSSMIRPSDIAELVTAVTRLSASATIPVIAVARPGKHIWRA